MKEKSDNTTRDQGSDFTNSDNEASQQAGNENEAIEDSGESPISRYKKIQEIMKGYDKTDPFET